MSSEENQEKSGFKVTDRRLFNEEGELRSEPELPVVEESPRPATPPAPEPRSSPVESSDSREADPPQASAEEPTGVEFSSFVVSLATTAMVHLGEIPEAGGQAALNVEAARQMIDVISMLKNRTSGNLSAEENRLLEDILYELRMKFLAKSKSQVTPT